MLLGGAGKGVELGGVGKKLRVSRIKLDCDK